jgi:hypothetical protein
LEGPQHLQQLFPEHDRPPIREPASREIAFNHPLANLCSRAPEHTTEFRLVVHQHLGVRVRQGHRDFSLRRIIMGTPGGTLLQGAKTAAGGFDLLRNPRKHADGLARRELLFLGPVVQCYMLRSILDL